MEAMMVMEVLQDAVAFENVRGTIVAHLNNGKVKKLDRSIFERMIGGIELLLERREFHLIGCDEETAKSKKIQLENLLEVDGAIIHA